MAQLQRFPREYYPCLLGADKLPGPMPELKLEPYKGDRTILIGIGGLGVRTLDRLKGELERRLDPSWRQYTAFLAMDRSWYELGRCVHLTSEEQFDYPLLDADERFDDPMRYPLALRRVLPRRYLPIGDPGSYRLLGRVSLHDQRPGGEATDQQFVSRLCRLVEEKLVALPDGSGRYMVYLIGSVCGGTGGGGLLELPALIRHALPAGRTQICAMLYLPDVLRQLDPMFFHSLSANGYATLKELNYYMGMSMRPGYPERWGYNDPAQPELELRDRFIDLPYLIGARPDDADPLGSAVESVVGYLAMALTANAPGGGLTLPERGQYLHTPAYAQRVDAPRSRHEFPECYAAIGFARASVPQRTIRAYEAGQLCEKAGLSSIAPEERARLAAWGGEGAAFLPFRGEQDLVDANTGTQEAVRILGPVLDIISALCSVDFSFAQLVGRPVTWELIREGIYDPIASQIDALVEERSNEAALRRIRDRIGEAFTAFRSNVKDYVKREGPLAFWNVYQGRFAPVGHDHGIGIETILTRMTEGKLFSTETKEFIDYTFGDVVGRRADLRVARDAICAQRRLLIDLHGMMQTQANNWVSAMDEWVKARIRTNLKPSIVGDFGMLMSELARPAAVLAEQIRSFGYLLESMSGIYKDLGRDVESFETFQRAQDNKAGINLAGIDPSAYNWILGQTQSAVANANAAQFRDGLVEDFFKDPDAWLSFSDELYTTTATGEMILTKLGEAIPARARFDDFVAKTLPTTIDVSIENMFDTMQQQGLNYDDAATQIVQQLRAKSAPLFDGEPKGQTRYSYIVLPEALNSGVGNGAQISAAITKAANSESEKVNGIYYSADTDGIMWYRFDAPFEIGQVPGLAEWERDYELHPWGIRYPGSLLHGLSPDVAQIDLPGSYPVYEEHTPWADYPPITIPTGDPRLPDPNTGEVSREGKILQKLDELVERAKELGVLYCNNEPDGSFQVYRVFCDRSVEWSFYPELLLPDKNGFLPLGRALAESVAAQNCKILSEIAAPVTLHHGGVLSDAQATEKQAWEAAARVLRVHMPMQIEVRETLKLFSKWGKKIKEINVRMQQRFLPGMMLDMVRAGTLRCNDSVWTLVQETGGEKVVANLSERMRLTLKYREKVLLKNGLLAYLLYTRLNKVLGGSPAEPAVDAFKKERARAVQEHSDLAQREELETLQTYRKLADELVKEIAALRTKGALLQSDEDIWISGKMRGSLSELTAVGFSEEELEEIQRFYARLALPTELGVD